MRSNVMIPHNPLVLGVGLLVVLLAAALLASPWFVLTPFVPLAMLLALLVVRAPRLAYFAVVALIPFGSYRQLPAPLEGMKVHWLLAAALGAVFLLRLATRGRRLEELRSGVWPWLLAFLGVNLLAAFMSPFQDRVWVEMFRWGLACGYILLTLAYLSPHGLRVTLPAVIRWSVTAGAALAVLGYYGGVEIFLSDAPGAEGRRGLGGAVWSNTLAMTIYVAMPFMLHGVYYAANPLRRTILLGMIALNLVAMNTTLSRLGFLMLVFVGVMAFIEYFPRLRARRVAPLYFLVVFLVAVMAFSLSDTFKDRLARLAGGGADDTSIARRSTYLLVAREAFAGKPLLGHGPGTFRDLYARTFYALEFAKNPTQLARYAHNSYLEVVVGSGVIGLALFLALLVRALVDFTRAKARHEAAGDREGADLVAAYRIAFLAIILYFFAGSGLDNKYFLLLLPVSTLVLRYAPDGENSKAPAERPAA